jgi:hypothetical protein
MSYKPTVGTVGKAEIRCQPLSLLAALSVCLLYYAYVIPFTKCSVPDISRLPRDLQAELSPRLDASILVVLPSHNAGNPHNTLGLADDSIVCEENGDQDSFEEDPEHRQAFPESSRIPLGEFTSRDCPWAPFLPIFPSVANRGLMSRRF